MEMARVSKEELRNLKIKTFIQMGRIPVTHEKIPLF